MDLFIELTIIHLVTAANHPLNAQQGRIPMNNSITNPQADRLQVGDSVTVEIHRGSRTDGEGISTGGEWVVKRGFVLSKVDENYVNVKFNDGDFQCISARVGEVGFPYRNAKKIGLTTDLQGTIGEVLAKIHNLPQSREIPGALIEIIRKSGMEDGLGDEATLRKYEGPDMPNPRWVLLLPGIAMGMIWICQGDRFLQGEQLGDGNYEITERDCNGFVQVVNGDGVFVEGKGQGDREWMVGLKVN